MRKFKTIIISILICFFYLTVSAQTNSTIKTLEIQHQACLDKGQYMLGCTKIFYYQMDSLLNVQYKKLRSKCQGLQKENLKDEQLEWLLKRDKQFNLNKQSVNKQAKKEGYDGGQDETMILIQENAMFIKKRVVELISISPKNYSPENYKVNQTGFYNLDLKTEIKNNETYGYFGDIVAKKISNDKVIVRLFICKGAPSYNSGSIADTLILKNNKAIYKGVEFDSSCRIIFTFFRQGIKVEELTDNYNSGCGFGHAVVANGFFKKKSSKIPTIKELNEE
jgi:uncharacterized protein YecT (DUF1311 family)